MARSTVYFVLVNCVLIYYSSSAFPVERFTLSTKNLVDLSYSFDSQTVYWPSFAKHHFQLQSLKNEFEGNKIFRSNRFSAAEHGGTHMDAPYQRTLNGFDPSEVPLDGLTGPLCVINITSKATLNPDYRLSLDDIFQYESKFDQIPNGAFVFLFSDWGKKWPKPEAIFNSLTPSDVKTLHFPGFHPNATEFLVKERNIRGIGTDGPSTDFGQHINLEEEQREATHRILADNNRIGLEFVANLGMMPAKGASVLILPMKIVDGSGAPARIIGILPEEPVAVR